jgi:hypothetical protein
VDKTAVLGLHYIEAFEGQRISAEGDVKISTDIPTEVIEKVRRKLASAHVTLTSLYIHSLSGRHPNTRSSFSTESPRLSLRPGKAGSPAA